VNVTGTQFPALERKIGYTSNANRKFVLGLSVVIHKHVCAPVCHYMCVNLF